MAYDIILSSEQQFSSVANPEPFVQPWAFSPASPIELFYVQGETLPSDIDIEVDIKDYLTALGDTYDEYYVQAGIVANSAPVIALSGDIPEATGDGYELTTENLSTVITVAFQNFSIYENITKVNQIYLYVYGRKTGLPLESIEFVSFKISVRFVNSDSVFVWPTSINFQHVLDEALPASQDVDIYAGGDFTIQVLGHITLSGAGLTFDGEVDGYNVYSGTGSQTISIGLSSGINSEQVGLYFQNIGFIPSDNTDELTLFGVYVNIFADYSVSISPTSLEFFAIKNVVEAQSQSISVLGYGAIEVETPSWLNATIVLGYENTVIVEPISEVNLSAGLYEGNIIITVNGTDYTVTVVHNVYENIQLGLSEENLNFTDDYDTITEFYNTPDFSVNLDLSVNFTSYGNTIANSVAIPLRLGLFNNRASFFIGKSVRNVMKELLRLGTVTMDNFSNQLPSDALQYIRHYYNPATVDIDVVFENESEVILSQSFSYENVKFIKGRKPKHAFPDSVLLDYYKEPLRVTPNSVALFNFYKEEPHTLRIIKNGVLESTISHFPGVNRIFAYKHSFSTYSPGDVIEIRLHKKLDELVEALWYNNPDNYVSQEYIVFPEGKESYHIGWEDEYGVCSVMEFTGSLSFNMNFENNTVLNYERFLETLRKIESRFAQSVTCNTGFILKGNTKRIESLLKSKRAWIISKVDEESIPLVPVAKKLSGSDTDRGLYEYDIEFTLNPDYDYKSYT